jgi:hypothetical protein
MEEWRNGGVEEKGDGGMGERRNVVKRWYLNRASGKNRAYKYMILLKLSERMKILRYLNN